jgi:type III restriction enzyme
MPTLNEKIQSIIELQGELETMSQSVTTNLNPTFELRPYQEQALSRLQYFYENPRMNKPNSHLLFHMATGSGKTIIMASSILYLYQQGYRNFLFFVNSTNIINKTRDNFLNTSSTKYLFAQSVEIAGKRIEVVDVPNFQSVNPDTVNICFTTIQGLHDSLGTPGENKLTFEDFESQKIVLISDEAHHINASTRKGETQDELIEKATWESTISKIHFSHKENILLEYTATIDLKNPHILAKYEDKLIFDYPLREFRKDGYSKEVKVLQIDSDNLQRALVAVILSQYRLKLFAKNKLNIKPVILFKSKTIKDSQGFVESFTEMIDGLKTTDLVQLQNSIDQTSLQQAFRFFEESKVTLENLVLEIKSGFGKDKLVEVNSKQESEEKQMAVNTLEDANNQYRGVFAVDKLNEGWDVLNLFDIVRLYETRDSDNNRAGKTTISEAQLIGRGARYCPFKINHNDSKYQRKYDQELENELRICEELYYYSSYNPKYIQELTSELKKQGVIADTHKQVHLKLKESFKQTEFYKNGLVWTNKQVVYDRKDITSLDKVIENHSFSVNLTTGYAQTNTIFNDEKKQVGLTKNTFNILLGSISLNIIRKAIHQTSFYHFDNLQKHLPNLTSSNEFTTSKDYLDQVKVEIKTTRFGLKEISSEDYLDIAKNVLNQIAVRLNTEDVEYRGTKEFEPQNIKHKIQDKVLNFAIEVETSDKEIGQSQKYSNNTDYAINLDEKDWYVFEDNFGTSEEKYLVKTIDSFVTKLQAKHEQVYLVRNEKTYRLFDFAKGRPFEPDFILFLKSKEQKSEVNYQIFIEPKGGQLIEKDIWKEEFLLELEKEAKAKILTQNKQYRIWGMPFYNEKLSKGKFNDEIEKLI